MKKKIIFVGLIIFCLFLVNSVLSQEISEKEPEYIGEFFDIQVPVNNYYFVLSVLRVFGNKWGPQPKTPKDTQDLIWDQLLLSYQAYREGITLSQYEKEQGISRVLKAEGANFDFRTDKQAYEQWVKEKTNEDIELFENQIEYLLQIEKLRQQIFDSVQSEVTDEEAYQEFLNEHNSLNLEIIQFDSQEDAQEFFRQVRGKRKLWDKKKEDNPDNYKQTGLVALECLIDIWKLPKQAVYDMMKVKISRIYGPSPVYKGYGVFKVLEKKFANKSRFVKLKDSYYNQIRETKKKIGFNHWFQNLKKEANIKIYK